MRGRARWLMRYGAGAVASGLAVTAFGLSPAAAQTGPVSPSPATGTPALASTGTTEQVRQLVQCGTTMYAVGTFTEITWNGITYPRDNVFSFSATAPYTITSWAPDVNGTVNSIALTADCGHAYIGGSFTQADGVSAGNVAYLRTYNNTMVKSWAHDANGPVNTVLLTPNGHLLAGGQFTSINGSSKHGYYASLNPGTGRDDGYLDLKVSGHYSYPGSDTNTTEIYNQQLAPDGDYVLAEGVFTSVQGQPRQQIFMLHLAKSAGNVTPWTSGEFNSYCSDNHPLYVKSAAWSPDGQTVYVADTGFHPYNWGKQFPLTGLCDAAAAFPSTLAPVSHSWINYTGCYTLLSVAADSSAVYIGGHELYGNNPNGCKNAGPGSYPAPGMGGIDPATGSLLLNSGGTAGLYSRSRGLGADDMLVTSAGLWIASDNMDNSDQCGATSGLAGICFLPYPS
jgi:hypothetical protein